MGALTPEELDTAVGRMELLKYFPSSSGARSEILRLLDEMIGPDDRYGLAVDKLDWLVTALRNCVGEWPGPIELRAIYCKRYKPADGVEVDGSTVPGFTDDDVMGPSKSPALPPPVEEGGLYLPAPDDTPITPEESQSIDEAFKRLTEGENEGEKGE